MKRLTILFFALFAINLSAQETTFKKFYKSHSDMSAFSINLNASFAGSFLSDDEDKDFKKYLRKNKLKTMASVKSDNSKAAFYILEENDIVKEIILRANSDDDKLVLFGLKTNLTTDELAEMMSNSNLKISNN